MTLDREGVEGFVSEWPYSLARNSSTRLSCEGIYVHLQRGIVVPDETLLVTIPVDVGALPCVRRLAPWAGVTNLVRVSGWRCSGCRMVTPTTISSAKRHVRDCSGLGDDGALRALRPARTPT